MTPGEPDVRRPIRGVLFDLDGTLYRAKPLRKKMLVELGLATLRGGLGRRSRRRLKVIKAYRHALEELRHNEEAAPQGWRDAQYERAAELASVDPQTVRDVTAEWMEARPLKHLPPCGRPHLRETLIALADAGLALGVFSDYPVQAKLEALGIADLLPVQLHAGMDGVPRPKPHPDGLLRGCELLGLEPPACVYVGDRPEVDAVSAQAAGFQRAYILGDGVPPDQSAQNAEGAFAWLPELAQLPAMLGL